MDIEEELEIGIKVLAFVHCGFMNDIACHNCSEEQSKLLNCDNISADNVIYTDEYLGDFTNCPLKWISNRVYEWWDEFNYYKIFSGSAPKYGECGARFWECSKVYEATTNILNARKRPTKSQKEQDNKNSSELSKLREGLRKKKNGK